MIKPKHSPANSDTLPLPLRGGKGASASTVPHWGSDIHVRPTLGKAIVIRLPDPGHSTPVLDSMLFNSFLLLMQTSWVARAIRGGIYCIFFQLFQQEAGFLILRLCFLFGLCIS